MATSNDKKWYESYKSIRIHPDKKKSYSLNNDLVFAIEERNIFAHRVLDKGDLIDNMPLPKDTIRFARLKNDYEPLDYTNDKFNELVKVILYLTYHFQGVIGDIVKEFG